ALLRLRRASDPDWLNCSELLSVARPGHSQSVRTETSSKRLESSQIVVHSSQLVRAINSTTHASVVFEHEGIIPSRINASPLTGFPSIGNAGRPGKGFSSRIIYSF